MPQKERCACSVRISAVVALETGVLVEVVAPVEAAIGVAAILEIDELDSGIWRACATCILGCKTGLTVIENLNCSAVIEFDILTKIYKY